MVRWIIKALNNLLPFNVKDYIAPLLIGGVVIFAGGSAWYYANQADKLKAELSQLTFQKQQIEIANSQLAQQLQAEKQAVENQQRFAKELQEQADVKTETVRTIFKTEPCANTPLPSSVIEQLRKD